jgi:hypothetical protein
MQMGTRASAQPAPAAVPRSAMLTETPTLAAPLAAAPHPESPLNPLQSAPSASADATLHCLGEPRRRLRGPKRSGAGLEAPRRPATGGSNLAVGGGHLTSHTWHVLCCMLRVACYRRMAPHLVHSAGALPRAHHASPARQGHSPGTCTPASAQEPPQGIRSTSNTTCNDDTCNMTRGFARYTQQAPGLRRGGL